MSRERWRPIGSAPGYEASDRGRVRNALTGRVLRQATTDRGYRKVSLGRARQEYVHRLVCEAFHGAPPLRTHHADHIDFNKANNRPSNLRWLAAHLNMGRHPGRGLRGWEVAGDEAPADHVPLSDDERAAADLALARPGW